VGYPVWDIALGGGVLMGVVAIAHVIVSHFAIGGGLLIAVSETLAVRRKDNHLRELARRSSLVLILISTVFGAISGVGIWVVAGLISPGAISALIHTYVWGWAIEWTFFVVEIVAALVYYSTWNRISKGAHLLVGWIYFIAAYLSLVIINGIVTFMLTPGKWLGTRAFWDGFFNPTYWPSLLLRTGICLVMAAVFMAFSALRADKGARPKLMRFLGWWLILGSLLSYVGYRWWEAALPEPVLALFRGAEPLLATLATTRSMTLWTLTIVLVVAAIAFVAIPKAGRAPAAIVAMVFAFAFFGGYERLREGSRKPFLIHSHMFSNGLLVSDIEDRNKRGMQSVSGWINTSGSEAIEVIGGQIFKAQCASCHTRDGYLGIRGLLPSFEDMHTVAADEPAGTGDLVYEAQCSACHPDADFEEMREMLPAAAEMLEDPEMIQDLVNGMISGFVYKLHDMGVEYASFPVNARMDPRVLTYPYMPPFVGNDEDIEALTEYLSSLTSEGVADSGTGGE
jgi:mono/diheme cytochrome c family protein